MTFEATSTPKKNTAVMYGLINAGVSIAFTVMLYLMGASAFVGPVAYVGIALPIVVTVLGGLQYRKQQGGVLSFQEALKTTVLILIIGSAIATIFQFILFNYIDVAFRQALNQAAAEKAGYWMRKMGAPDEQVDKQMEQMMDANNYSIGKLLLGFAFGCIGSFIIAAIISAIIKKKPQPFQNSFQQ